LAHGAALEFCGTGAQREKKTMRRPASTHSNYWILFPLSLLLLIAVAAITYLSRQGVSFAAKVGSSAHLLADFPKMILWAWERPENLSFIDPAQTGVAFLARTLYLRDSEIIVRPRLQPLRIPPGTAVMAVARIETDASKPVEWSQSLRRKTIDAIAELSSVPGIRAVQIDFDARQSERKLYRELLRDVRSRLDPSIPLSITALASWCMYDNWLTDLPVDEAVPMLFRMGVDERNVRLYLDRHRQFAAKLCQTSVGVSLDEPLAKLPAHRRIYVFNPKPWSQSAVQTMLTENKIR
jgi:hypothetical protein